MENLNFQKAKNEKCCGFAPYFNPPFYNYLMHTKKAAVVAGWCEIARRKIKNSCLLNVTWTMLSKM